MDGAVRALVTAFHATSVRCVLAVTGGGATAAGHLLSVPGASRTILEANIPYNDVALAEFLGRAPDTYCSAETARRMAARAHARAEWLAPGSPALGLGCTASLRSDRPKKGDHRFHVAAQTSRSVVTHSVTLIKELRDREGEEAVVAEVVLNLLAEAAGIGERVAAGLTADEPVVAASSDVGPLAAFLAGKIPAVRVERDGQIRAGAERPILLLPGSFNPLHHAHVALAEIAAKATGKPVSFEMTIENADKPPLADGEVRRRLGQFAGRMPLWLTRAPTFPGKSRLFPGATFIVGADTAARIVDRRFYGDSEGNRDAELAAFRANGCQFLVAGRTDSAGRFLGLDDLTIPEIHRDLFTEISAELFRMDVSSSQLRAGAIR